MDFNKESISEDEVFSTGFTNHVETLKSECQKHIGFLKIQSANEWIDAAKDLPVDKMLFDGFWYEGEICVLFAKANLGKSILGYQIANSITKGNAIHPFRLEAKKQAVLYFDFELNEKKFRKRYTTDNKEPFKFNDSLKRIEIDTDAMTEADANAFSDKMVLERIEQAIIETDIKVCIIDNMSYIIQKGEKALDATPFLFRINLLKKKYGLSILVLGHTTKQPFEKELELTDLAGSAAMGNFIDSAFAIGKVKENVGERYVKQVKQRDSEERYHAENVCIMQIEKVDSFLQMTFQGYGSEKDLVRRESAEDKEILIQKVKDLITMGKSYAQIMEMTGLAKGTISKYSNK